MKIGCIQYDVSKNIKDNIKKVESLILQEDSDLFILPELCDVGYLNSKKELLKKAQPIELNEMAMFLKKLSKNRNCSFLFGIAEKDGDNVYNTAVLIDNQAFAGAYRKIHLSDYEKKVFSAGVSNKIFNIQNMKIGVQICFDLWFPEVSREQMLKGADILCVLANFGGEMTYNIAKTRAVENLTPLALCNRVGKENTSDMEAYFLGKSTIIDMNGLTLEEAKEDIEVCITQEIDTTRKRSNLICNDFISEINKHYIK